MDTEDVPKIGELVKDGKRFAFQQFVPSDALDKAFNGVKPYPSNVIAEFAETAKKYVADVILRV